MYSTRFALPLQQKTYDKVKQPQAAGWVDANYQPLISRTQAALLADAMVERLGIREKWKTSEMQQHRQLQNVDLESGGVVE